ncbi:hypothetical protein ACKFKF_30250 [Phormidesmis sp. 146-12]
MNPLILLSFDLEEFDVPKEYGSIYQTDLIICLNKEQLIFRQAFEYSSFRGERSLRKLFELDQTISNHIKPYQTIW